MMPTSGLQVSLWPPVTFDLLTHTVECLPLPHKPSNSCMYISGKPVMPICIKISAYILKYHVLKFGNGQMHGGMDRYKTLCLQPV